MNKINGKNKTELCPWHPRWFCRECGEIRSIYKTHYVQICDDCGKVHSDKRPMKMKIVRWNIKYIKKGLIFKAWKKVSGEMEFKERINE